MSQVGRVEKDGFVRSLITGKKYRCTEDFIKTNDFVTFGIYIPIISDNDCVAICLDAINVLSHHPSLHLFDPEIHRSIYEMILQGQLTQKEYLLELKALPYGEDYMLALNRFHESN